VKKVKRDDFEIFTINGTPADCIDIGLYDILDSFPKMVISGINQGANVGHARILSSGTIGAAMEASIEGVKALASSLRIPREIKKTLNLFDKKNYIVFENPAKITVKLVKILIDKEFDDDVDLFSVNMPFDVSLTSEIEITKPSMEPYGKLFHKKDGGFGLITPSLKFENLQDGTDLKALYEGKISITPVSLALVSNPSIKKVEQIIKNEW
jgi:5'-nucleotidase